ncbi:MAG TPA: SDR family NAD(P)-dependent oxidoreductase [Gemmatimonadales bacterium]|nr:SDR family NAD(P)-dependent oxidoreductase [Gemmatimonadales bacterium]
MTDLAGRLAWVTGAGSGIGEAAAKALARANATVVLTGRRVEPLEAVAEAIRAAGGLAAVAPGDLTDAAAVDRIVRAIGEEHGRLDILVNNAGVNIRERSWSELEPAGIDALLNGNLSSAFYAAAASLPLMRANRSGVMIHTASWAGRFISPVSGPAYTAAKHAVVAMSHSINMEEFANGIRSSVICPAEVATPILDRRPQPISAEDRALMLQPDDLGELILFIATRPKHVCMNEVLISPAWNRGYLQAR